MSNHTPNLPTQMYELFIYRNNQSPRQPLSTRSTEAEAFRVARNWQTHGTVDVMLGDKLIKTFKMDADRYLSRYL